MKGQDFTITMLIEQAPGEVFKAISNVGAWWQGDISGNPAKIDDEFTYRMEDIHFSKQKIVELVPNKKMAWLITDSKLNFTEDKSEWTGTKIIFELSEVNNKTQLRFTHSGLVPELECYKGCSSAWARLVQKSLFSLITTGKGQKVF